ncbi:MAG: TlpA disulfide reductase family protein [Candidatus Bipolaricaulota bacterium]|nr:TlpA disulfide reductase family protein [Candidatus Bipolaricaulota bacterium]
MLKTLALIGITVVVLFVGYTQWTYLDSLTEKQRLIATSSFPIVGEPAPDFSLPSLDGGSESLGNYAGRPLVIDFWTTWCGICKSEFPLFEEFHRAYGERVPLLTICSGTSQADAVALIEEGGYTFPVLYDDGKSIARAYQPQEESVKREITAFPFTVFIDASGTVVYAKAGIFTNTDELLQLLRKLEFPLD